MTSPAASPTPADDTVEADSAFVGLAEGDTSPAPPAIDKVLAELYPLDPKWEHDRLDFAGDKLAVRVPLPQALAGFSLSSSKYVPAQVKNDMTGLFLVEHLGPDTYNHVMQRLYAANDADYGPESLGQLLRKLAMLSVETAKTATDSPE